MTASRRLLWLHENFVSARQGGNSRATLGLAALLEAGWQVDLICTTRSYLGETYGKGVVGIEQEGGLRIHRLEPGKRPGRAHQYIHFCRTALRYADTLPCPDLIFTSSPSLPQVAPALWLASRHRLPLVLEVRDLWPAFLEQGGLVRASILLSALRGLESLVYRRADQVISVSPAFSPYLEAMGVPKNKLTTAPTGADPNLLKAEPVIRSRWRAQNQLEDAFLVLYAGSFNRSYGLELIEQAMDASTESNIHWLLAGAGEREEEIQACAERNPNVHYLGLMPKNDLRAVLSAVDLGISTHAPWSLLETTISGKLFDYLAAGLPVVNLAPGQMAQIVQMSGAGWQSTRDSSDLLEHIVEAAAMTAGDRVAMGRKGQDWLRTHMHGSTSARQIAASVDRASKAQDRGIFDLGLCALGACKDLFSRLHRRSLRRLYGPEQREKTIRSALTSFLDSPLGEPARELKVPELLSD